MRESHKFGMALIQARDTLQPFFPGLTWKHVRAGIKWALAQDPAELDGPPKAEPGKLLTIDEAGARLGFKRRKIEYLIAQGKLRAVRLGKRSTRIPETEVTAFAIGRRNPEAEALRRQIGLEQPAADADECISGAAPCGITAAAPAPSIQPQDQIQTGDDV